MYDLAQFNIVEALSRALQTRTFSHRAPPLYSPHIVKEKIVKPKILYPTTLGYETHRGKARRVKRELLDAGATAYGLLKSETRVLPKLLHADEHVEAVIYGQHNSSSAMLVATNERIIYIDKKPMAVFLDEVSYEVISGIEFDIHLLFASVILHTPVKNYNFTFVNLRCAESFARHIEMHRLERESKKSAGEVEPASRPRRNIIGVPLRWRDMAGYSWLPTEEEERQRVQQLIA